MSDEAAANDVPGESAHDGEAANDAVFHVMHVESILYDLADPSPGAHLIEAETPFRYLIVPLALADAIALNATFARVEGKRPSTHELATTILTRLQTEVIAARIVRYEAGVFYAELDLMTPKGRKRSIVERVTRCRWHCARAFRRPSFAPSKYCGTSTSNVEPCAL